MTRDRIFLIFCLSFIGGIFIASLTSKNQPAINFGIQILSLISGIILISVYWQIKKIKIIGFMILFFIFGFWRFQSSFIEINLKHIAYYNNQKKTSFVGLVKEVEAREKTTQLTVEATDNLAGKILITAPLYPVYQNGDLLAINCAPKAPSKLDQFDYPRYLEQFDIYSVCYTYSQDLKILDHHKNNIARYLNFTRTILTKRIGQILPKNESTLLSGLILGGSQDFPKEVKNDFAFTGITHITAVSGMNITLIAAVVLSIFLAFGFWRKDAFYLASLFLFFYIILIGAPASAVRAGIMGFIFLLAQRIGRLAYSGNAIVLAAFIMLLIQPKLLIYDIGFELSFAAALGLIYIYPILDEGSNYLAKMKSYISWLVILIKMTSRFNDLQMLKSVILLTFAAQIATLPLTMRYFNNFSIIAPIANLVTVPLIAPITIWGFISVIASLIYLPLGRIFGWLIYLPLDYIINISHYLTKIPFAHLQIKISWWLVLIYYLGLITFLIWYNKKRPLGS